MLIYPQVTEMWGECDGDDRRPEEGPHRGGQYGAGQRRQINSTVNARTFDKPMDKVPNYGYLPHCPLQ